MAASLTLRSGFSRPLLFSFALLLCVTLVGLPLALYRTRRDHRALIETQAKELAKAVAIQVAKEREVYTESVVTEHGAVPLPATFVRKVAERLEAIPGVP